MKKLHTIFVFISFLVLAQKTKAQWVNIPDSNFRNYLVNSAGLASAVSGNMLDTTDATLISMTSFNCLHTNIHDLTGIQYFDNINTLDCSFNKITYIPALPHSLIFFTCDSNLLTTLPVLPSTLGVLSCNNNQLTSLPTLPASLTDLYCSVNHLTSLPNVSYLSSLGCSNNLLDSLPTLSTSLSFIQCQNNHLTKLPTLPSSLTELICYNNLLTTLPPLSQSLNYLLCNNNLISILPALPPLLTELYCFNNHLTSLPTLPSSINALNCDSNLLYSIPTLPSSLLLLSCAKNPNLHCLPNLNCLWWLTMDKNNILCLPNRGSLDASWLSYPVCTTSNINNCQVFCNSYYNTTYDTFLNTFILTIDTAASNLAISYHWDFGDGTSSSLATPTHVYTVDTVYNVCLQITNTVGDSCTYCKKIGKDYLGNIIKSGGFSIGVKNNSETNAGTKLQTKNNSLVVFPNPCSNWLELKFYLPTNENNVQISIYDLLGQKVKDFKTTNCFQIGENTFTINSGQLLKGVYQLQLITKSGIINKQIVIQ
jgi:hypothetical protein